MKGTQQADERRSRRLDAYIRVSQVAGRDGDSFISPGLQEERIRAWAAAHGHEIIAVHRELDVSGGSMDRPLLNEVLRRIEGEETDGIVVYNLSRFARTQKGTFEIIERINKRGALFASVSDNFDVTTISGRQMLAVWLAFSVGERERAQETWRTSRSRALGRGVSLVPFAPFGYLRRCGKCGGDIKTGNRRDRAVCLGCGDTGTGVLVVDPAAGPIVTEVFRRRAAGYSWSALCAWLNDELGVRTSRGNPFGHQSVMGMIRSRVYLGDGGGGHAGDPPVPGAHPALTDEPTWYAAQQGRRMGEDRGGPPALGKGLIRCAGCRYTMVAQPTRGGAVNYRCRRTIQVGDCPDPSSIVAIAPNGGYRLDDYLVERFLQKAGHDEAVAFDSVDTSLEKLAARRDAAHRELEETEGDAALYRDMGARSFGALVASLRRELEAVEAELEEANTRAGGGYGMPIAKLRQDWPSLPLDMQRRHLAQTIQHVFVRPAPGDDRNLSYVPNGDRARARDYYSGRVHIVWAGDPPVRTPRRGDRTYVIEPFLEFVVGHAV